MCEFILLFMYSNSALNLCIFIQAACFPYIKYSVAEMQGPINQHLLTQMIDVLCPVRNLVKN